MNAFDYLNEMKNMIEQNKQEAITQNTTYSAEEHFQAMRNMLDVLELELQSVEYHYSVEGFQEQVFTFEEHTVVQKELSNELLLIQPVELDHAYSETDMLSLCDILKQLKDNNVIKQDIVILPPNVNVLKAKLAKSKNNNQE